MQVNIPHTIKYQTKLFWNKLEFNWPTIYKDLYNGNHESAVQLINSFLPDNDLEIEVTTDLINSTELSIYKGTVELYISPKLKHTNLSKMRKLYLSRVPLQSLIVSCFKAYHPNDSLINEIKYTDFSVCYDDFACCVSYGHKDNTKDLKTLGIIDDNGVDDYTKRLNNTVMNIIIIVKKNIADHVITKKTIKFYNSEEEKAEDQVKEEAIKAEAKEEAIKAEAKVKGPNDQTTPSILSTRDVWLEVEKYPVVSLLLLNILGEKNLMFKVGYIEILHENDPLVKDEVTFFELAELKNNLLLITKPTKDKCNYCLHDSYQVNIRHCGRCRQVNYCNVTCQKADWSAHQKICKVHLF